MPGEFLKVPILSLPNGGTGFDQYRRVILSGGNLALAGATDKEIGTVALATPASGIGSATTTPVLSSGTEQIPWMIAAGAITQYGRVYGAANGQVSATPNVNYIGIALTAANNAGEQVVVQRAKNDASSLLYTTTAAASVNNTVVETNFDNFSLPANILRAGDIIEIYSAGQCVSTNSTDTFTFKAYLGGVLLFQAGPLDVANNDSFEIFGLVQIRTIGAGGTFAASGYTWVGTPGVAAFHPGVTTGNVATNAAVAITVTGLWSVANAGDQARREMTLIERLTQ